MKNKPTVYILLAVVALIWGMIGYQIYTGLAAQDDSTIVTPVKTIREAFDDYSLPEDTGKLLLNYRDPFGQVAQKDTSHPEKVVVAHPVRPVAAAPLFNWDFIKYSGYLRDPASKKLIAFFTINGKDVTLAEGETMENVRLLRNLRDSVKISFNGRIKYLALHARTL